MYLYYYKLNCFLILYGPDHIIASEFLLTTEKYLGLDYQTSSHFRKPNSEFVDDIEAELLHYV